MNTILNEEFATRMFETDASDPSSTPEDQRDLSDESQVNKRWPHPGIVPLFFLPLRLPFKYPPGD